MAVVDAEVGAGAKKKKTLTLEMQKKISFKCASKCQIILKCNKNNFTIPTSYNLIIIKLDQ